MEETKCKRLKLDPSMNRGQNINSILSDEFTQPIEFKYALCLRLSNPRFMTMIMKEFATKFQLNTAYHHLKRIRNKTDVILCTEEDLSKRFKLSASQEHDTIWEDNNVITNESLITIICNFVKEKSKESILLKLINEKEIILIVTKVPASAPKLRWQYDQINPIWPSKFHPNNYTERLYENSIFNESECREHFRFIEACLSLSVIYNNRPCGIVVDPRNQHIVAAGCENTTDHPLAHCTMILIDLVAKTQNGGAWNQLHQSVSSIDHNILTLYSERKLTLTGIDDVAFNHLQSKYPEMKLGAQKIDKMDQKTMDDMSSASVASDNLTKYGPYLCTGYDVYLMREPCTMCAMALTHSRARRVFFNQTNDQSGALKSIAKLHTVKALNHHFEVFQVNMD